MVSHFLCCPAHCPDTLLMHDLLNALLLTVNQQSGLLMPCSMPRSWSLLLLTEGLKSMLVVFGMLLLTSFTHTHTHLLCCRGFSAQNSVRRGFSVGSCVEFSSWHNEATWWRFFPDPGLKPRDAQLSGWLVEDLLVRCSSQFPSPCAFQFLDKIMNADVISLLSWAGRQARVGWDHLLPSSHTHFSMIQKCRPVDKVPRASNRVRC